ncbi:MAG: hypothetical protein Q7R47_03510, partial [Candidatus Diapherotrites archaeon]|nr:hypothetical protein [Candidatus Diapherotrites archaeon]
MRKSSIILCLLVFSMVLLAGCLNQADFNNRVCHKFHDLTGSDQGTVCAKWIVSNFPSELDELGHFAPGDKEKRLAEAQRDSIDSFECPPPTNAVYGDFAPVSIIEGRSCASEGLSCAGSDNGQADCAATADTTTPKVDTPPYTPELAPIRTSDSACDADVHISKGWEWDSQRDCTDEFCDSVQFIQYIARIIEYSKSDPQYSETLQQELEGHAGSNTVHFLSLKGVLEFEQAPQADGPPRLVAKANAYLMPDGFSQDFRNDFDEYYRTNALFAKTPTDYTAWLGGILVDPKTWVIEPEDIEEPGLYGVTVELPAISQISHASPIR